MNLHRFALLAALSSSPAFALDVEGPIRSTSGNIDVRIQAGANGAAGIGSFSNDPVLFFSASTERMRLSTSGYLGVGTTAPRRHLHIFDPAGWPEILIESGYNPATNGRIWGFMPSPTDGRLTIRATNADISTANGVITFDPGGNIGIGVSNPSARLEIADAGNGSFRLGVPNNASNAHAQIRQSLNAVAYNSNSIASLGAVSWNCYNDGNSPSWSGVFLNHNGSEMSGSTYGVPTANSGHIIIQNCLNAVIGTNGMTPIYISPFGQVAATFTPSGNVGIGTSSPTHKLAVNGTIKAKEVIVETTGWSDYVFADDYHLAPLAEIEEHIKANKHLPGIPSAAQVAENGVSLGEVQAALLAKVEELTLHLIAQEKNIAAQQNQLSAQQQAMQNLQLENTALQKRLQQVETR